jgi:hypothetical protein
MDNKKLGIILILVGLATCLISLAFSEGYNLDKGFLGSISEMKVVLTGSNIRAPEPVPAPEPAPPPGMDTPEDIQKLVENNNRWNESEKQFEEYEKALAARMTIPYKFVLAGDIIIVFTGIGFLIIPSKNKKILL